MNFIMVAAVSGFLVGDFISNFFSENIAHRFEDLYAKGFYAVPPAPDLALAHAPLDEEEAYLSRLCKLPADDRIATTD